MRLLILGIGNILFGDEGAGAHFAHYLDENFTFSAPAGCEVAIIDGGTLAHALIPLICEHDNVLLIDCLDAAGAAPGEVFYFPFSAMPDHISWQGSAHELETLQTLQMMRTHGDIPPVQILGVIPRRIGSDPTFSLSAELLAAAGVMEQLVREYLAGFGVAMQRRSDAEFCALEDIAKISFKRQMRGDACGDACGGACEDVRGGFEGAAR